MIKKYFLIAHMLFLPALLKADFISLIKADQCESILEYFVGENGLRVTFEIGRGDAQAFKEIVPTEWGGLMTPESLPSQLEKFARSTFILRSDGRLLLPELVRLEMRDRLMRTSLYTNEVDSGVALSPKVWYVELFYPWTSIPSVLELNAPVDETGAYIPANAGFVCYHKGIPVNDLRYMVPRAVLHLDRNDPWYSSFENVNLRRHHSSSLMSFLYVDPYEVRHEVLIRLKDLEEWLPLSYGIDDRIPAEHLDSIREWVGSFIQTRNPLSMDGKPMEALLHKVQFLRVTLAGTQIIEENTDLDFSSTIIGVILSYPNGGIPKEVTVDWDMFSEKISRVPYVATDPAGPLPGFIEEDFNRIVWKNYMKNYTLPTVVQIKTEKRVLSYELILLIIELLFFAGFLLAKKRKMALLAFFLVSLTFGVSRKYTIRGGVDLPFTKTHYEVDEAKALTELLLSNIYRSFDYTSESEVYDKLALSIQGDLLSEVYIQIKKSMALENQGGLEVKVEKVTVHSASKIDDPDSRLAYQCKWMVEGEVGHWGHIHRRNNLYEALLYLDIDSGTWKLKDMEVLQETRIL